MVGGAAAQRLCGVLWVELHKHQTASFFLHPTEFNDLVSLLMF